MVVFSLLLLVPVCSGGQVSGANPLTLSQPIRLEKILQLSKMKHVEPVASQGQKALPTSLRDFIDSCDLLAVRGKELTLRVHYRVDASRRPPIYAGAWLYDASGQSVDAGYKPVAVSALPNGSVDIVLVLPDEPFVSDYVETFLMESGQPAFTNGRFKMAYSWAKGMLSATGDAEMKVGGATAVKEIEDHSVFCREYAATAVAQYNSATSQKLPGIAPPVWSNDYALHYNWCLRVPRENARQGSSMRQDYLNKHKRLDQSNVPKLGVPATPNKKMIEAVDKTTVVKPINDKKLDPGLGP